MCLMNSTKKGIEGLPKEGVYYKVLRKHKTAMFHLFSYHKGVNVIPENAQRCEIIEERVTYSMIKAGGHFFRNLEDANTYARRNGATVVRFRIKREDISHIGRTDWWSDEGITVVARKARML